MDAFIQILILLMCSGVWVTAIMSIAISNQLEDIKNLFDKSSDDKKKT